MGGLFRAGGCVAAVVVNVAVSRVSLPNVIISLEDVRNRVRFRGKCGGILHTKFL